LGQRAVRPTNSSATRKRSPHPWQMVSIGMAGNPKTKAPVYPFAGWHQNTGSFGE
jgi:hypothetical protein